MTHRFQARATTPGRRLFNRRDFLKLGGAGLAGATPLGAAARAGGEAGGATPGGRLVDRRGFLKRGGAGLAGAALLGAAGCGGGGGGSFNGEITLGFGREPSGTLQKLIDKFNKQSKDIKVTWRPMPADTGQYFDQLRTQFQIGRESCRE